MPIIVINIVFTFLLTLINNLSYLFFKMTVIKITKDIIILKFINELNNNINIVPTKTPGIQ